MSLPPDKQPPGGWRLKVKETKATVPPANEPAGENFAQFVDAVNDNLVSNGFQRLSWETILERTLEQAN